MRGDLRHLPWPGVHLKAAYSYVRQQQRRPLKNAQLTLTTRAITSWTKHTSQVSMQQAIKSGNQVIMAFCSRTGDRGARCFTYPRRETQVPANGDICRSTKAENIAKSIEISNGPTATHKLVHASVSTSRLHLRHTKMSMIDRRLSHRVKACSRGPKEAILYTFINSHA